jgi:hypothetical protein
VTNCIQDVLAGLAGQAEVDLMDRGEVDSHPAADSEAPRRAVGNKELAVAETLEPGVAVPQEMSVLNAQNDRFGEG